MSDSNPPKSPKTPGTLSLPGKPATDTAERSRVNKSRIRPGNKAASRPRATVQSAAAARAKGQAAAAADAQSKLPATTPTPAADAAPTPTPTFTRSRAPSEGRPRTRTADAGTPAPLGRRRDERATGPAGEAPRRPRPADAGTGTGAGRKPGGASGYEARKFVPGEKRDAPDARRFSRTTDRPPRAAKPADGEAPRKYSRNPAPATSHDDSPRPRPAVPTERKMPEDGRVRVSKLLSERGLCSRREADEFIERGWVFVDGQPVKELGTRVFPNQEVTLNRDAKAAQLRSVTFLLNKPIGFVSGQPEPGKKPAMTLLLPDNRWEDDPSNQRFEPAHLRGLAPAGRLDIDSTGLIVFTQDGRVARHLIGDDSSVEKEYLVRVEGQIQENGLQLLNRGLSLDGQKLKPAKVSWQNEEQLRFVLREGRKRQIRRMCELVGLTVVGLKRIRIGSVVLGKLPPGKWRYLRDDERF